MRLQGIFVESRFGKRIALLFVLAAAVPMLLLGLLAHRGWVSHGEAQAQQRLTGAAKASGLRVLDRLLTVRALLQAVVDSDASPAGVVQAGDHGLLRAVLVDSGAPAALRDQRLLAWWQHQRQAPTGARLHVLTDVDGVRVVLSVRDERRGVTVLGELEPARLWRDLEVTGDADRACVHTVDGMTLHCAGAPAASRRPRLQARWNLFLRHEFGVDDWVFVGERSAESAADAGALPVTRIAWQVLIASLLLVAMLSLVLARRTIVPLLRLTEGTRRLAAGDYAARVAVPSRDEFGELAASFNHMAERIGAQVREMTLLSRQLEHRASHDSLTGLLNRAGLHDALERSIAQAHADAQPFALLFVDLDRFKTVNDSLGHDVGDELLRIAARRLAGSLPETAVLARPGGDEFVALLADADASRLDAAGAAVCRCLGENFALRGHDIALGASVGIAVFPDDGASADELLRHADMAMYAAKQRGRGRAARFEAALDDAAMHHAQVLRDLRQAVPRGELVLHYQPRVDAATGRARSVEALVRWNHPARGLLSPAVFIDVAEETGLIVEIGRWVLQEACRQMALWRRQGVQLDHVAINVSVGQLRSVALASDVESALRLHGLTPADLEIEVTESLMVGDPEAAAGLLRRLAALGVRVALDDFGTGYSSMSYLRQLPIDVIKVDRAFVRDLGVEPSADAVARAIVALATSLDMSLVAEGVETEAQAALLRAMGCQELQGFLYARPLPPDAVPALSFVDVRAPASDRNAEVLA